MFTCKSRLMIAGISFSWALLIIYFPFRAVSGAGSDAKSVTEEVFTVYLSGSDTRSSTLDSSRSDVNILLVADPSDHSHTKGDIEQFFSKKVEELYGYPEYRLDFRWMDEIPPDQNGKMRCFICEVR